MKRLALILGIAAVIVLAFVFLEPSIPPVPTTNLTISNFAFSEASLGPAACDIRVESKIIFEGPIAKPTPCNGLTANYTIEGNIIKIYITTTSYEGFCAQVIADTFYTGSFDLLQLAEVQIYYAGEKICEKTVSITGSDKEQACINSGGTITTGMCCSGAPDFSIGDSCLCSEGVEKVEIKTCTCGTGKVWDGTTCTPSLLKMNGTAKNDCINSGGTIEIITSVGGAPISAEVCQCEETKYLNGTKCVNRTH